MSDRQKPGPGRKYPPADPSIPRTDKLRLLLEVREPNYASPEYLTYPVVDHGPPDVPCPPAFADLQPGVRDEAILLGMRVSGVLHSLDPASRRAVADYLTAILKASDPANGS
jgi:hypothetical protein